MSEKAKGRCPYCDAVLPKGATFCNECGWSKVVQDYGGHPDFSAPPEELSGDEDLDRYRGLYNKFEVRRTNPEAQARHQGCRHFVLDLDHDPHAIPAILSYADSCEGEYPRLARDLRLLAERRG